MTIERMKQKNSLPDYYSMSFPGIEAEVLYILVSMKIYIGDNMDKGHYACRMLDENTGTWWNFDDATIIKYSGYPKNVYDNLSIDNEQKKGEMSFWMDQIGSCQCYILKMTILH